MPARCTIWAVLRHLNIIGTLGVLRDAARHRLLDISTALDRLRTQTNFRATEDLYAAVLEDVRHELGE
jgi:predicted nucleic acid-binding protein